MTTNGTTTLTQSINAAATGFRNMNTEDIREGITRSISNILHERLLADTTHPAPVITTAMDPTRPNIMNVSVTAARDMFRHISDAPDDEFLGTMGQLVMTEPAPIERLERSTTMERLERSTTMDDIRRDMRQLYEPPTPGSFFTRGSPANVYRPSDFESTGINPSIQPWIAAPTAANPWSAPISTDPYYSTTNMGQNKDSAPMTPTVVKRCIREYLQDMLEIKLELKKEGSNVTATASLLFKGDSNVICSDSDFIDLDD